MQVYPVSNITAYLRELLESDAHLADLWVSGEVSNVTRSAAGHLYFTLKDADAQLRCVFFRGASVQGDPASLVEGGAQVVAHGRISLYEVRGDLQYYVDFVQPEGMGVLAMEFERLKARLAQEGLFDEARKRPLPAFPRRIGVVTSPTGAVFHDICSILERRWPLAEVVLAPTAVQGAEAAPGIVAAIAALNEEPGIDVIIVARGGGSLEELWPFNEETVARAVYASRVPVVSAVGHETDYTIADYVADLRAPTPSAAAELVAPDRRQVSIGVAVHVASLVAAVESQVNRSKVAVGAAVGRMERGTPSVDRERQRVDDMLRTANAAVDLALRGNRDRIGGFLTQLRSLHPQATLQRGYALVERDGDIVKSVRDVRTGDRLGVRVSDGAFAARVEQRGRKRAAKAKKRETATQPTLFPDQ
jgi:exodeoxyribonuclease VII large subunit